MATLTSEQKASRKRVRAATQLKYKKAFELKLAGYTLQQIADELGYATPSGAMGAVERHLAANAPAHERERARQLQIERIEAVIRSLYPAASRKRQPDRSAQEMMLRYLAHAARLGGLFKEPQLDADRFYEDIRRAAREEGLDEDDAVREAEAVLARHGRRL